MADRDIIGNMRSIFGRVSLFLFLFFAISGLIGYWVIGTPLLYPFYFYIYGNMGKVLLLSGLAFLYLTRWRWSNFKFKSLNVVSYVLIIVAFLLVLAFYPLSRSLLPYNTFEANFALALLLHATLVLSVVFLFLGVFSFSYMKWLYLTFKHEVAVCFVLSVVLYFMIFQVWKLWPYFSGVVLEVVYYFLQFSFENVATFDPLVLRVNSFSVIVGQACSGIDSIFLFTVLYWFFGVVDWHEFNKFKLVLTFLPAVLGLFAMNILRIYLLVLIGALWSPALALGLFHTYAGLILFMLYFLIFWKVASKWLKTK